MRAAVIFLVTAAGFGSAAGAVSDAVREVNRIRGLAGLPSLTPVDTLAVAARRHADYLDRHRRPGDTDGPSAHAQLPDHAGFSGEQPADRALAAGYPHRVVLENVSMGYPDLDRAIGGLMGAIYHRLTFLNLAVDEIGTAVGARARVFVLGRGDLVRTCLAPPPEAIAQAPVDCLGTPVARAHYDGLCREMPEDASFLPPHPFACPDGTRLDAAYMAAICAEPPPAARFAGAGYYFEPCGDDTRIDAAWLEALCQAPPPAARYPWSGDYFDICDGRHRVRAEWLEGHCAALPESALDTAAGLYREPCAAAHEIRIDYLGRLDDLARSELPDWVLWPPPGASGVPPAFFREEPDPLPDLEVSGYPVSLQFNPTRTGPVELLAAGLHRIDGQRQRVVEPLRLLDQGNDPHGLLIENEFAVFPTQRLDWATRYRVSVEVRIAGAVRRLEWEFTTAGVGHTVLEAHYVDDRFEVDAAEPFLLYLPPTDSTALTVLNTRIQHLQGDRVHLEMADPNTLQVHITGTACGPVELAFDDGRNVALVPRNCGPTTEDPQRTAIMGRVHRDGR